MRRRADPHVSVADLSRKIELWFSQRGNRDVNRLLRPLRELDEAVQEARPGRRGGGQPRAALEASGRRSVPV